MHSLLDFLLSSKFSHFKDSTILVTQPGVRSGTYKVRNEIETKRNETKSTKTKRNETKRNQRNENEIKRNQRKQNEINENKTKYDARLLPAHVSVSFIRRGQDFITIEQE